VSRAQIGEIEIFYDEIGDPAAPPVLLVMGLGAQMTVWQEGFRAAIADRGYRVIRFDNRDVGLSTHLHDAPPPDVRAAFTGDASSAAYTLSDMAADTTGLLDSLGIDSAHVVGASMGGMIAQTVAIEHPERVRSLTSIMSTTGDRSVGQATPAASAVLLGPPAASRDEVIERAVTSAGIVRSPAYPTDEAVIRQRAGEYYDRAFDPAGVARQLVAVMVSGDRTPKLAAVAVPTVVIHGEADPLVDPSGGRATAAAVPGAELVLVPGMGHDLPEPVWPQIVDAITAVAARAEADRG
jgi:pimeloyl-ACP methyl ester carboxylesterase